MKRGVGGGSGGAPPPRRSSAVELSSLVTGHNCHVNVVGGATLGGKGLGGGPHIPGPGGISGSRSAATSPVGGASAAAAATSAKDTAGSPRHSNRTSNEAWVCPNDRQLALRAKLQSGWSVKTANLNQWKQPDPLSAEEHEMILQVVEKAEAMERAEQERLGRLVERLEGMRQSRLGNGETDCVLCGEVFRFYHHSQRRCGECHKMTCNKCGREHLTGGGPSAASQQRHSSSSSSVSLSSSMTSLLTSALLGSSNTGCDNGDGANKETVWLCKICGEQREMWKKSGAWFFKGMPKFSRRPGHEGPNAGRRFSHYAPLVSCSTDNLACASGSTSGRDEGNSSEDEGLLASRWRGRQRGSISSAGPAFGLSSRPDSLVRTTSEATDEDDTSTITLPSSNGQSRLDANEDYMSRSSRPRTLDATTQPSSRSTSMPPVDHILGGSPSSNGRYRPSSPASSIGSPVTGHPPVLHRGPPPPRSMSPRYFRPPPGYPAPRGPPRGGPPPHWASRSPFRPPFDQAQQPPFSPRGMPRRGMPRRGFPPGGARPPRLPGPPRGPPGVRSPAARGGFPGGPYGGGPPRGMPYPPFPHSAPHSPLAAHRQLDHTFQPASGGLSPTASLCGDGSVSLGGDLATPSEYSGEPTSEEVGRGVSPCPPDAGDEDTPRTYNKAKPLAERENKFTSTLRRLSTVRKRNKSKKKLKDKESSNGSTATNADSEAATTPSSTHDFATAANSGNVRPSSTTSRDSDTEALTSGYFSRQESQSRGSDETLSSPRSPEGSHGLVEFSISYDEVNEQLLVNVIKAKKIKGMDGNGLSDSYCKVSLVPPLTGKTPSQQCTKTVAKSVNPHYNAMLHFSGVTNDVVLSSSVHAVILDEDLAGDNLLAEAKFPLKKILPQMQKKFQVSLDKPNLQGTHEGLILASSVGRLEVSLAFYSKQGTLRVSILRCLDLPHINEDGSANPFVQVILHPINKNSKHRTTVKWKTLDPEFHEQFVYLTSITELPKQSLYVTAWDRGKARPDDYIGGVILGLNAKGGRLQHWTDMIKQPNQVHSKTHFLSANYID